MPQFSAHRAQINRGSQAASQAELISYLALSPGCRSGPPMTCLNKMGRVSIEKALASPPLFACCSCAAHYTNKYANIHLDSSQFSSAKNFD